MRVFITGASGFIGAAVLRLLLARGIETAALVSPDKTQERLRDLDGQYQVIPGRLEDIPALKPRLLEFKPDAWIHLAWYAEPGKYLYAPENVPVLQQSLSAMQTLIETGCRQIVGIGTCAEYDTDVGFLREDGPTKPATIYAACKLSMCLIGQHLAQAAGVNFAWGRMFYLYGEQEDPRRLVPALMQSLREGKTFDVTPGEQVRDYLHVRDVASAIWTLTSQNAQGIYNIASGNPVTMRTLMETIGDVVGGKELIRFGALPYRQWEPMFICGDNQKLKSLGWSPEYSLRTGLEQMAGTL